jgi:predicted PurR-regulated permease PerM
MSQHGAIACAVLIPLVASVLISYALEPFVVRLVACRLPRAAAVPLLLAALLTIGGAGTYTLRGEAVAFLDRLAAAAYTGAQAIQRTMRGKPGNAERIGALNPLRPLENESTGAT